MCLEGGGEEERIEYVFRRGWRGGEERRGWGVGLRILGEHKIKHKISASNIIAIQKDARALRNSSIFMSCYE